VAVGGFLAVGAVAGSWLVAATAGPVVAAVVYVGLGKLPGSSVQAENERIVAALPQACDLIAAALQAGLPLRNATEAVADSTPGPLGKALSQLCARVRLGASESEAWLDLSESPGLGQVGRELGRSLERGMAVSGLLAQLAEAARKEATNQAVVKARRVGVRSVMPLMVCFLPAFILLGIVPIIGGVIGGVIGNILP
jgi:Flp pilus assembly protein TadB